MVMAVYPFTKALFGEERTKWMNIKWYVEIGRNKVKAKGVWLKEIENKWWEIGRRVEIGKSKVNKNWWDPLIFIFSPSISFLPNNLN